LTDECTGSEVGVYEYSAIGVRTLLDICMRYVRRNAKLWNPSELASLLPKDVFDRLFPERAESLIPTSDEIQHERIEPPKVTTDETQH
jgi:hypothetical protein